MENRLINTCSGKVCTYHSKDGDYYIVDYGQGDLRHVHKNFYNRYYKEFTGELYKEFTLKNKVAEENENEY